MFCLLFSLLGISALRLAKPHFPRQYNMEPDSRDFMSLDSGDYLEIAKLSLALIYLYRHISIGGAHLPNETESRTDWDI